MGIDLLLLGVFLILAEKKMMGDKYLLFSPYFILNLSILYIYVLPIIMVGTPNSVNYLSRLSYELVAQLLTQVRLFYYIFAIFSLYSIHKISENRLLQTSMTNEIFLTSTFMFFSWVCLIVLAVVVDFAKVGFSPGQFIQMQINPREFTYLRSGLGPLTYITNVSKMLLLFISTVYFFQKKTFSALFVLLISFLVNLAGGSKSSLLIIFIFVILVRQKNQMERKLGTGKFALVIVFFSAVAFFSFYIMCDSMNIDSFSELVDFITSYAQEAFYSAKVIDDFSWIPNNIWIAIRSFFLTPIPRFLFPDKGYYGFYQECWRNVYQEGSVLYQSSTYGFLAEGHMLFGFFSPILLAFIINKVARKIYIDFCSSSSLTELFILSYLFTRMYFYTRSGYFDATNLWALITFYVGSKLFFFIMNKYMIKKKSSS